MPTIICPKCKKEYDIEFKVLGRKVTCKRCEKSFEAKVLRQQLRKPSKVNPLVVLFSILGLGLFIIVILIIQSSLEEPKPEPAEVETATVKEAAPGDGVEKEATTAPERGARELFCLAFLEAVAENDIEGLQQMFNFPVYHRLNRGDGEPQWNDFDDVDRIMKKQEYTDQLTGDHASGGGFVRYADVLYTKEKAWDGTEAEIEVGLEHRNNGRQQERIFKIKRFGSSFTVIDYEVGAEHGGDLLAKEEGVTTLDQKYGKRISPLGEIAPVEYPPDTEDRTKAELKYLLKALTGDDRTKAWKAREKLVELGKPAIPGLLNQIVGLDMKVRGDVAKANKYVTLLRKLTGRTFGFDPTFMEDGRSEDLERSLKRWFGWWERNKDTWTEREELDEGEW